MKMAIIARSRYYETKNNLKKEIFLKNYYIECLSKIVILTNLCYYR